MEIFILILVLIALMIYTMYVAYCRHLEIQLDALNKELEESLNRKEAILKVKEMVLNGDVQVYTTEDVEMLVEELLNEKK